MKYRYPKYKSEIEALQKIVGLPELQIERIDKPFHHKERVSVYTGTKLAKKYRSIHPRAVSKTYNEANAHVDLSKIGVNVPYLFGILHSDEECSLLMQYIDSGPLTSLIISSDPDLEKYLVSTGVELGKMFEYGFIHGDLTSYHILVGDDLTYIFDLETTRQFHGDEFYNRLVREWRKFINSTQGRRWKIPFNKEQEEMVFEGVRETLNNKKTRAVLENLVLEKRK